MQHRILTRPTYAMLEVDLEPGEEFVSESGAMAWMSPNVKMHTSTRGGALSGLKRKLLAGESFFQNTYTAEGGPGTLALAPRSAGDIAELALDGDLILEKSSFLGSEPGVKLDSQWQGLRGLLNEGLFVMRAEGRGMLFFEAYGQIEEIDVDGEYVVDNGYAVAWESSLAYRVTRARKIRSFLFSDQLLLRFSGRGRLWTQSRSPRSLASFLYPFRPQKRNND